ncbi:MAG TPA: precorrin-2 C(20)-methyltransferase [Dissulfurispiraceae bacterium]|nr:precorrin-2 C(20)-methyltransferase [Dissulfurispiraceae bacterium]
MTSGTLYVIGIGPGDPELLTLKAVRILESVPVLCVPKGREEGTSLALSIVKQAVKLVSTEIIEVHFPMTKTRGQEGRNNDGEDLHRKWDAAAREITSRLERGKDVAFITLGDPSIYSTYFYLHDAVLKHLPGLSVEFVPGVSSVTAAAARAGISLGLGNEKIAILPATYINDIGTVLAEFDTVVLMKVHSVFRSILPILKELHLEQDCIYIARAGMPSENIVFDISMISDDDLDYFSILIIRAGRRRASA